MKKLKYISLCLLAMSVWSCDDDETEIETRDVGGNAVLVDRAISVLDQDQDVSIQLFTNEEVQFESVEIQSADGAQIATATITGETATFNTSSLGDFVFGEENDQETGAFNFVIVSILSNGSVIETPARINVVHAIELDELAEVRFMDPTSNEDVPTELGYSIFTHGATVDDLSLEWKIGSAGTYVDDEVVTLDPAGGVIDFADLHYTAYGVEPGDTLYYRFTAASGSLMDQVETSVVFVPQGFGATNTATLSDDAAVNQLDLSTGELSAADSGTGDIVFLSPTGFEVISTTDSDLQFVEVDEEGFFDSADLMDAREAFEAGTPVTSVTNVEAGDVFVYKVTRMIDETEVVYYGILQVGDITVVNGTAVSFDLEFAEGAIVE